MFVDAIVRISSTQETQKIDPAFALRALKPGEEFVPNMRAVAVFPLMPRSRIIRVYVGGHFQPGTQDIFLLLVKTLLVFHENAVDLPRRNINSPLPDLLQDERLGHAAMVV